MTQSKFFVAVAELIASQETPEEYSELVSYIENQLEKAEIRSEKRKEYNARPEVQARITARNAAKAESKMVFRNQILEAIRESGLDSLTAEEIASIMGNPNVKSISANLRILVQDGYVTKGSRLVPATEKQKAKIATTYSLL